MISVKILFLIFYIQLSKDYFHIQLYLLFNTCSHEFFKTSSISFSFFMPLIYMPTYVVSVFINLITQNSLLRLITMNSPHMSLQCYFVFILLFALLTIQSFNIWFYRALFFDFLQTLWLFLCTCCNMFRCEMLYQFSGGVEIL